MSLAPNVEPSVEEVEAAALLRNLLVAGYSFWAQEQQPRQYSICFLRRLHLFCSRFLSLLLLLQEVKTRRTDAPTRNLRTLEESVRRSRATQRCLSGAGVVPPLLRNRKVFLWCQSSEQGAAGSDCVFLRPRSHLFWRADHALNTLEVLTQIDQPPTDSRAAGGPRDSVRQRAAL